MSRVDKLHEAGDMDLGGVDVTTANDATVRSVEDERTIDGVEIAEREELWSGAREVSCCRHVATEGMLHDHEYRKLTFMSAG